MARHVSMINLCGVLVVANLLFLFGINRTESKVTILFEKIKESFYQRVVEYSEPVQS